MGVQLISVRNVCPWRIFHYRIIDTFASITQHIGSRVGSCMLFGIFTDLLSFGIWNSRIFTISIIVSNKHISAIRTFGRFLCRPNIVEVVTWRTCEHEFYQCYMWGKSVNEPWSHGGDLLASKKRRKIPPHAMVEKVIFLSLRTCCQETKVHDYYDHLNTWCTYSTIYIWVKQW